MTAVLPLEDPFYKLKGFGYLAMGAPVGTVTGSNRFAAAAPVPQRPEPDAISQQVLDAAKADKAEMIAKLKKTKEADAEKLETAKAALDKELETRKELDKEAIKAERAADKAQKTLVMMRANIKKLKEMPQDEGSAFGLESLEAEAKVQETTAKAAVEKAKESAKAAHAQEDKIVAELSKVDDARMTAARSRSFWVTESMIAQITAGDSEIGADAEADHEEYMVKIQKMVEDAPSMDAIIATRIELEQGNYPKPPAWLAVGGADAASVGVGMPSFAAGASSIAPAVVGMPSFAAGASSIAPAVAFGGFGEKKIVSADQYATGKPQSAMDTYVGEPELQAFLDNMMTAKPTEVIANNDSWMKEQDRLLESMVAAAVGRR